MNKTLNINLGGFFFHIDENAYQKLKRYLDAIAKSLGDDPQGKSEIIADIETRISELLSERITDVRQVVNESDIEEIIAIMGQPEDYAEAEEGYTETTSSYSSKKRNTKKLFRDGDDKFLGGVCSGLGHFIGIDSIWIRLTFILLTFSGFSPLVYIILWILLPEAKTTSEKLQMEGEAVNIDNIEKKIRNEFENLSTKLKDGASEIGDKISNTDFSEMRNKSKSGIQDLLDTVGKILLAVFKVLGKFIGVVLIITSAITLISLVFGLFSFGSIEVLTLDNDITIYPPFIYDATIPKWILAIVLFILIGIPFVILLILGLRILSPNIKRISTTTAITLFGIWLISLFTIIFTAIEQEYQNAYDGTKIEKHSLGFDQNEPLKIKVINDDELHYLENLYQKSNAIRVFENDKEVKYSNDIRIDVRKSESEEAYIRVKKMSEGKKRIKANNNAAAIKYNFKQNNNTITFDAFFLSDLNNLWKDEEIKVIVYVPENTVLYFENSSKYFLDRNINTVNDRYYRDIVNHKFKMTEKGLECEDCEAKESSGSDDNEKVSVNTTNNSFLYDSTINDYKAELIITKETTRSQLQKLARWFKERKNISIDYSDSEFYPNGKIKNYNLKVNCNDGFEGTSSSKGISIGNKTHGFIRIYDSEDDKTPFKIW
ncbi:PspC domain-containing protein [Tenacibaculum sp. SG-28]|uniref:PspC domain-containing protein n=1 Tax=Tenacibaculum sp. SG-28 TaxID=754426 RepID=UPI000CF3BB5C|nr:PspC domain-containing protein [Tenacibaculum sp. SG-28]PQJ19675.1 hypothetical protein BSU00_11910 [Tenacibaculum sp. SG-28]